jgi:hypothetical protein
MYAITTKGVGTYVGARSIEAGWPLADGETFTVSDYSPDMVLADDGNSLRKASPSELTELAKSSPIRTQLEAAGIVFVEPVPVQATISDRQFFQALALAGKITDAEALAAVKTGDIPAAIQSFIDAMPSDQKFAAEMLLSGATVFDRNHPMTALLGSGMGWTSEQLDALWQAAAAL